jgi:hypothetical protein
MAQRDQDQGMALKPREGLPPHPPSAMPAAALDSADPEPEAATVDPTMDPGADATLDPKLQDQIGRQLRAAFEEVVNQPVPDRFRQLLEELERKQGGAKGGAK